MCKCINTPIKRQYINAHFEMAIYHRKRVATIINFLSFISIDIKGFPFNFGRKIFTGFEMTELQSWSISFFDILCSKIVEKSGSVTFKWMTRSWWLLLPFFCDKQPFQKGHLYTVSLLGYWYICISVYRYFLVQSNISAQYLSVKAVSSLKAKENALSTIQRLKKL